MAVAAGSASVAVVVPSSAAAAAAAATTATGLQVCRHRRCCTYTVATTTTTDPVVASWLQQLSARVVSRKWGGGGCRSAYNGHWLTSTLLSSQLPPIFPRRALSSYPPPSPSPTTHPDVVHFSSCPGALLLPLSASASYTSTPSLPSSSTSSPICCYLHLGFHRSLPPPPSPFLSPLLCVGLP